MEDVSGTKEAASVGGSRKPNIANIIGYAVKVGDFQWVKFPPGDGSLQPEAVGAAQEGNDLS